MRSRIEARLAQPIPDELPAPAGLVTTARAEYLMGSPAFYGGAIWVDYTVDPRRIARHTAISLIGRRWCLALGAVALAVPSAVSLPPRGVVEMLREELADLAANPAADALQDEGEYLIAMLDRHEGLA